MRAIESYTKVHRWKLLSFRSDEVTGLGRGSAMAPLMHRSHGIRFYYNIPVNRMLQTISNVKRKSKQHIKLVRALLHAVGLPSAQPAAPHDALCVCRCYCLQLLVLSVAILWPKSHLSNWSHVNDELSTSHTKINNISTETEPKRGEIETERARKRQMEKNEKENIFIYFLFYCYCCSWKMKWRHKATGHSHQTTYGRICMGSSTTTKCTKTTYMLSFAHTHTCAGRARIEHRLLLLLCCF